jgi:hypothetical protein
MKEYEIRVTALGDDNDMASCSHYVNEEEDGIESAQSIIDDIHRQFTLEVDLVLEIRGRVVVISESVEQQGFFYTVYENEEARLQDNDTLGGLCTGSWGDAIIMAHDLVE